MKNQIIRWILMAAALLTAGASDCRSAETAAATPITPVKGTTAGVYLVENGTSLKSTGNHVDNACLTYNGSQWTESESIRWPKSGKNVNVYAYAPYQKSVADAQALNFSVKTDQSTADAQTASDFLYGTVLNIGGKNPQVSLRHLMSRLVVKIAAGEGFTTSELQSGSLSVRIKNVKPSASIRLDNGKIDVRSGTATISPRKEAALTYSAILIPQDKGSIQLSVTFDNQEYVTAIGTSFSSGQLYTVTATLKKTASGINVSIGGWEDTGEDYGGTVN